MVVQDLKTRRTIASNFESHGLYRLSGPPVCAVAATPLQIHSQLGHPHLQNLQKMMSSVSDVCKLNCESCQLEKQSHPFSSRSNKRASTPFSLVHSDI